MRKIVAAIIICSLASCSGNSTPDVPNSDTAVGIWKESIGKPGNSQTYYGMWLAHIQHLTSAKPDSLRLIVTGTVELARPNAKVILIKADEKKQADPSELVLNLSKQPRKTMNNPAVVNYSESISKKDRYKKIRIMYAKDTVAIISVNAE